MAIIDKPSDYFNTKLYTGNGGTQSITGVGFQPNMTWIKGRSFVNNHFITDSVRGVTKTIFPDLTAAEETQSGALTAFGSDGFSVGSMSEGNTNGATICSWNWKAGTSVSGTSTGSGTGKAYSGSVNTTSGFSIIKYLGNGSSGHTIPHHLSAVPKFIVVKSLDRGTNWITYQAPLGAGKFLRLNQTNAESTSSSRWNDTTPTSTVFTVGNDGDLNNNDDSTKATFSIPAVLKAEPLHVGYSVATTWSSGSFDFNFGNPPFTISSGNQDGDGYGNFEYAVPSGYFSLNTKNLAEYG